MNYFEEILQKYGRTSPSKPKQCECEKCQDTGFITKTIDGQFYSAPCQCEIKKQMAKNLEKSGIDIDVFNGQTFETFRAKSDFQKHMKRKAMEFLNQKDYPFFFAGGQVGCGKTHICNAICHVCYELMDPFLYVMYNDMITEFEQTRFDQINYEVYMGKLQNIKVLYIDDLFKGKGSSRKREDAVSDNDIRSLFKVINHRYLNNKMTIISSEWFLDEIISLDEGIGSRIKEKCGTYCCDINRDPDRNYRMKEVSE